MKFETFQLTLHKLLEHFLNKTILSENLLSNYLTSLIAEDLLISYQLLDNLEISTDSEIFQIDVPPLNSEEYQRHKDSNYLRPLIEIYNIVNSEINSLLYGCYLHGSLATMDYIRGWSDVDILVVLSKETIFDKSKLMAVREVFKKINALMKKIDPLQHHGIIAVTEIDLKSFSEDFPPLEVLKQMKFLGGKSNKIELYSRKSMPGFDFLKERLKFIVTTFKKGIFEHHAFNNEYLVSEYRNADNGMYQLKYYLGQFLLLPSLYLMAKGDSASKKESFEKVRNIFSEIIMDWIDLISSLRIEWGERESLNYIPNKIPSWVQKKIPRNYFEIGAKVAKALLEKVEQENVHIHKRTS